MSSHICYYNDFSMILTTVDFCTNISLIFESSMVLKIGLKLVDIHSLFVKNKSVSFIQDLILNEKDLEHWIITEHRTLAWPFLFIFVNTQFTSSFVWKVLSSLVMCFWSVLCPHFSFLTWNFYFSSPTFIFLFIQFT